jgi:hypothetical protein
MSQESVLWFMATSVSLLRMPLRVWTLEQKLEDRFRVLEVKDIS